MDGRSIVNIMAGYGCNVPAIISTRTQKNKISRIINILIIPFVPCAARLPMITLFSALFFKKHQFIFMFGFNLTVLLIIFITSYILNKLYNKENFHELLFEFPRLQMPNFLYLIKASLKISLNYISKILRS